MTPDQHYRVRIDAEKTSAEFKAARKLISVKTKQGIKESGQRYILPPVKHKAPAVVSAYFTTKVRSNNGYVTTQGPRMKDRIAGLLNFGGLVSTKIVPKRRGVKALHLRGTNIFLAQVGNGQHARGRKYRGKKYIEKGVVEGLPLFERGLTKKIMESFGELAR